MVRANDLNAIMVEMLNLKNMEEWYKISDITHRLHQIKKPFFFVSSLDDIFFGRNVIPIDQCHDNILLGVTRYGGHITYLEGGHYMPHH